MQAFFFQPPEPDGVPPAARLAQELGLNADGLTLRGPPGTRTVIGCSAGLSHTLSPERSAITLGSASDLLTQWIAVVRVTLTRLDVGRPGRVGHRRHARRPPNSGGLARRSPVGTIRLPHTVARQARGDDPLDVRSAARQFTDIVFFDALDPKPEPGKFPSELTVEYELEPLFVTAPSPGPTLLAIDLPITTAPAQVPVLVSAGLAFSPYEPRGRLLVHRCARAHAVVRVRGGAARFA